ncbi:potassium channel family protein [Enterobacter asburiae]|uniref:potassium channel family protein n=1 Tax=Enterobacter asburiae TaxID=61645 RepID=UPI003EBF5ED6
MLFKIIILSILGLAALFYLFVIPPLVATGMIETSKASISLSLLLLFQVWLLTAEYAYNSASVLFGFKRKSLLGIDYISKRLNLKPAHLDGFAVLTYAFLSYLCMVYFYGVVYMFISTFSPDSFSLAKLGFIDGIYFSLVSSSTVGFGDIAPKSPAAKLIVISQIIISMLYVAMLFSSAVSYIRNDLDQKN